MKEAHTGMIWGRVMRAARVPTPEIIPGFWIITMMLVLVGLSTLKLR
jgi:UDP-N-acetylmuramyl pentapeptide phosphotransferase/UDP-N-acetylglucosamine-1-phosphate transferase